MKLGRIIGIVLLILGVIFYFLAASMLQSTGTTLKIFYAGPGISAMGLAMIVFPGGNITVKQSRNKEKAPATFYSEAPLLHKAAWIVAGVSGVFAANFLYNQ